MNRTVRLGVLTPSSNTALEPLTSAIVASRTFTVPPGVIPILVGGAFRALTDTGSPSPSDSRPESRAEKVR